MSITTAEMFPLLAEYSEAHLVRLKSRGVSFLRDNQLNNVGCARLLNLSYAAFSQLRDKFFDEFDEVEEELLADCEALIVRAAMGVVVEFEDEEGLTRTRPISPTQVATAKWILERRREKWKNVSKIQRETKVVPEQNGKGVGLLESFFNKGEKRDREAEDFHSIRNKTH